MKSIESADLVRYNANTRGTNTGDCTARAISLAFNMDYRAARKALNESAKTRWDWEYNSHDNLIKVIKELGGGSLHGNADPIQVNDWVDQHPTGTYIVWCCAHPTHRKNSHVAAVVDGRIYDSWDSRDYYVWGYWGIPNGVHSTDMTDAATYFKDIYSQKGFKGYTEYAESVFDSIVNKNRKLKKFASQYGINIELTLNSKSVQFRSYTFKYSFSIVANIPECQESTSYDKTMAIVFRPTMTNDEVDSHFDTTFYDKMYTAVYTIVLQIEDLLDGIELLGGVQTSVQTNGGMTKRYWSRSEERSFNSLPFWVRKLATYFRADSVSPYYGSYSDRVCLYMLKPPFDTETEDNELIFRAYDMNALKLGLEHYRKTGNYEEAREIAQDY